MKFRKILPFLFASLLILMACNRHTVKVLSFSPDGEVDELQTFTIEFSEDLAPADKLGEWLDEDFVSFDPPIEGRFKWTSPSTLIFSPTSGLDPSQDYQANINKAVLFGKKGSVGDAEYVFNTPHFDLEKVDLFWTLIPHSDYKLSVQANLHFNYVVDPDELKKYLAVEKDGNKITNFQIVSDKPADIIAINFGEIKQTKKPQNFSITVQEGFNSTLNKKPLAENRDYKVELPSITELEITDVISGFDGDQAWVRIFTTQQVDPDQVERYVSVKPVDGDTKISVAGNYFQIDGNFEGGSVIKLNIKKGLPGLYGGALADNYNSEVMLADLEPSLSFADKTGVYLMRGGQENVELDVVNVSGADVKVYEVFQNNLMFFLYNNRYDLRQQFDADRDYYYGPSYSKHPYGKLLYEEELKFNNLQNKQESITLNLNKALNQRFKGVYVIEIRSKDDYWKRAEKLVAVSDIGLVAKFSPSKELMVFANSIKTAKPVSGVKIQLLSETNQSLVTGTTDAEGFVKFANLHTDTEGFRPQLVTAQKGDDFNFVDFGQSSIETSRYDVGGKSISPDAYDCFVYSDRNIYRPGETAYLSAIVRDIDLNIIKDEPIEVKIISPRGKVFQKFQKKTNAQGSFELAPEFPTYAQTGQYVAEFYTGAEKLISSYRFSIEEFVPDKIRVRLDKDKEVVTEGETVTVDIEAEYLFGAAAANHKYEMDVRLSHVPFYSKAYPKYHFSNHSISSSYLDNSYFEGELDENGKAKEGYELPGDIQTGGYISGKAYVSVFDVTGRTVNRIETFKAYPKDYFVGIRSQGYYYGVDKNLQFGLVAVNEQDKAIPNFQAKVELIRYEWQTVLKKKGSRYVYQSEKKAIKEWSKNVTFSNGEKTYDFKVSNSGQHELRVYKRGSDDYVSKRFYAYHWGRSTASSFEINKEGQVDIIFDKKTYNPGDQAKVLFVAPFTGRMLVTVEREKVVDHFFVDMDKNSKEVMMPIHEDYVPNMYVTATLFRPHSIDNNAPFLVGHGYGSMLVENPSNKMPVTIEAPEKVKPRTTQYITVKAAPEEDIYVTLAAVDEGILQVKNFQTPDPYAYMYAKRRLAVSSYDLYKNLLPEVVANAATIGGGDMGRRQNPIEASRFKLLAKWSGIRKTDSKGEVRIPIELPQYNGEVRLMAVAYSGRRFGSADKPMKVSDDVVMMPAVPRFLSIKDSLALPVSLMNATSKSGKVKVSLKVEGPIEVTSSASKSVNLKGKGSEIVTFGIRAKEEVGVGKIILTTSGLDEVKEEIEIAVRPISPLIADSDGAEIKAGESKELGIPTDFLDGTQETSVTVSNFPAVKFAEHLKYIVGYPHGCLEQTTSKLFPQLYFADLSSSIAPDLYTNGSPVYYVKAGIRKLQGMANYDGSFRYWPGGDYVNWWGTVYATHFLVEAKKADYEVDESTLNEALEYIARRAKDKQTYDYYSYRANQRTIEKKAPKEAIYGLYVLAMAGKADESLMNYYRARPNLLTGDTRYLLAGAFAQINNWSAFNDILPNSFSPEKTDRLSGGSFDSEVRSNAIMLNVLLDVDPSNAQIPRIIKHLTKLADGGRFYSTQERSWAFLGLGKAASRMRNSNVSVDVIVDGKVLKTLNGKKNETFSSEKLNGKKVTLKAKGNGSSYFFWNATGIRAKGVAKEEDMGIKVRRTYYDRNGTEILGNSFKQGDLIVCKISLSGSEQTVENIAISDLIPAGFEIENPRLTTSASLAWLGSRPNKFSPDYLDVRDDRLLIFTRADRNKQKDYYYLMRVVNTGTYQLPAIGAEAMYDPDYRSYHGGKAVRVL